ncbi:helix-turn-helix domain-containing protein [Halobacillus seohaensis]|uniref:Helix-turn-helix domain-containing protein n=1 Tax=Halobacillus seohaensis TaxID=447421 RepID=A0ABW2EH55_9BACI
MKTLNLEFIRNRRNDLGINLQDMADRMRTLNNGNGFKNASTYKKYEDGDYKFDAEHLPLLAKILKCRISSFFRNVVAKTEINKQEVV